MKKKIGLLFLVLVVHMPACHPLETEVITLYDTVDVSNDSSESDELESSTDVTSPRKDSPGDQRLEEEVSEETRNENTGEEPEATEENEIDEERPIITPKPEVELTLQTGYMSPAGIFTDTGNTLYTCEESAGSNPQFLIQVGASLSGDAHLDPWFIRFEFESDTSEWVGLYGNTVYQSLEDCQNAGTSCDEVEVGEGNSGYPDQGAGHMGIQNVYCRYWKGQDYTINMTVRAITLNPPLGTSPLIAEEEIQIQCEWQECCPNANYLEIYGNHTTETWDCD